MAAQDDDRTRDTIRVPFIFVPRGQDVPRDWLAGHPDAVRIPARFVPKGGPDSGGSRAEPPVPARS